jgi:hypothetical protein
MTYVVQASISFSHTFIFDMSHIENSPGPSKIPPTDFGFELPTGLKLSAAERGEAQK